ncbi:MAG: hypothetical protein GY839_20150 [candidate division Zixibacteria bacterium]|nr:hypothetical protein [candidate division Zixibacteria bacterium]
MATIVQGMMNANIPWAPILVGGMIALAVELLGIQSLPFAIGLYLPLSLSTPLMAGGILAYLIKKSTGKAVISKARYQMGILFGSGLVAGDALIGVGTAGLIVGSLGYREFFDSHEGMMGTLSGSFGPYLSLIAFVCLGIMFFMVAKKFGGDNSQAD